MNNLALINLKAELNVNFDSSAGEAVDNMEVIKQVELFRCAQAKEEAIRLADEGDFNESEHVLENQTIKLQTIGHLYS